MIDEEKNEIKTKQDYWVVKGNALIQQSRFSLSLIEQKSSRLYLLYDKTGYCRNPV